MKAVMVLQDESCHWYIIPNELYPKWIELNNLMDSPNQSIFEEAEDNFIKEFSQYMTGGSPNNTQLYIKEITNG